MEVELTSARLAWHGFPPHPGATQRRSAVHLSISESRFQLLLKVSLHLLESSISAADRTGILHTTQCPVQLLLALHVNHLCFALYTACPLPSCPALPVIVMCCPVLSCRLWLLPPAARMQPSRQTTSQVVTWAAWQQHAGAGWLVSHTLLCRLQDTSR